MRSTRQQNIRKWWNTWASKISGLLRSLTTLNHTNSFFKKKKIIYHLGLSNRTRKYNNWCKDVSAVPDLAPMAYQKNIKESRCKKPLLCYQLKLRKLMKYSRGAASWKRCLKKKTRKFSSWCKITTGSRNELSRKFRPNNYSRLWKKLHQFLGPKKMLKRKRARKRDQTSKCNLIGRHTVIELNGMSHRGLKVMCLWDSNHSKAWKSL